ncbi:MAG: hypothetical protein HY698_05130 [Deltaproteobacteria bacterium]|nr:hypothetical protein [Deltaproteobacteria bacterium]
MHGVRAKGLLALAVVAVVSGCRIESGIQGPSIRSRSPGAEPASAEAAAPPEGNGRGESGAVVVAGDCGPANNHCLPGDVVFASTREFIEGRLQIFVARRTGEPDATGETQVISLKDGQSITTRFTFSTQSASPDQIGVGKLAIFPYHSSGGIHRNHASQERAVSSAWWIARVVSVESLAHGYIITSDGMKVSADAVRLVEGDSSKTASMAGAEDTHFFQPDHFIIATNPLPGRGRIQGEIGIAITKPSPDTKGEGLFIGARRGKVYWTRNAWRTVPATSDRVKVGQFVAFPYDTRDGVHQRPATRELALGHSWWIAKVVDTSDVFKGVITTANGMKVSVDAVRIVKE